MPEQDTPAVTHPGCTRYRAEKDGGAYCETCDVLGDIERFRATCRRWLDAPEASEQESNAGYELHDLGLQLAGKLEATIVAGRIGGA